MRQVFDLLNVTANMKGINYKYEQIDLPINFITDPNRL